MTTLMMTHQPIDVFDLRAELDNPILQERLNERAYKYVLSLAKNEKKTLKLLKSLGVAKPEECFSDNFKRFIKSKGHVTQTEYKVSDKSCEFFDGVKLPDRLWAYNPQTMQSVWGPVRSVLIGEETLDIDQKKSWMRCLLFILLEVEKKEWETPDGVKKIKFEKGWLEEWIKNADRLIAQWTREKNNVTKKSIKSKLATMANWGGSFKTGFEPFQKLNKELQVISKRLEGIPEFKKYVTYCEKKHAAMGKCPTIIGVLTRAVETQLTWSCVRELKQRGIETCVVVHDGMNIYKADGVTAESLMEICNAVCEEIALGCASWTCKPPDYTLYDDNGVPTGKEFRVPDDFTGEESVVAEGDTCPCGCGLTPSELKAYECEEIPPEKVYTNMKQEFEKHHCQVHSMYIDEEKKFPEPCVCSQSEVTTKMHGRCKFYEHQKITDDEGCIKKVVVKKKNFFPEWNDDEDKRFYRDLDVFPDVTKCPKDVYNLWQGYAVMRKARGRSISEFTPDVVRGVAYFYRHVHRLIDDGFRDFFWEFWCHLLKYPEVKPGILMGLLGHKRIGKGQTIDMISNQIGPRYYCMTSHPGRDVWGQNGTDYCDGKMLCRLAEPKQDEYRNDPGAMRVWITDNPVERKAMHKRAETIHNYTRFIHDGNDPVLPDEENGGRIAQTLCNPYWKEKWIDSPQQFVEYNTSLGQYIENDLVQVLLAFMILKEGCPKRFSFHRVNDVTGNLAKEERKRNRNIIEKFIIYLLETIPWDQPMLELIESSTDETVTNTIEHHVNEWSRVQSFREPLKARSITTMLGNWMSMKHGGITKERPWIDAAKKFGNTVYRFDAVYLRKKFALDEAREAAIRDTKVRDQRREVKRFPMSPFLKKEEPEPVGGCTCPDSMCEKSDEELLEIYREAVQSWAESPEFQEWLLTGEHPRTHVEDQQYEAAFVIQTVWRRRHAHRLKNGELERQKKNEERLRREQEEWKRRDLEYKQRVEDERRAAEEADKKKKEDELERMLTDFPPNPESKCMVAREYGGGECPSVKTCGNCFCDQHSKKCTCFQCTIRAKFTK
jgi:hypothetical protein